MRKRMVSTLLGVVIFFGFLQPAFPIDGSDWKALDETARSFYVVGVVDSWHNAITTVEIGEELHHEPSLYENLIKDILSCMKGQDMKYSQIIVIVDKYLADHPDAEAGPLVPSMVMAVHAAACGKEGKTL